MKAADLPLFAGLWFPTSDLDELKIQTFWSIWLFAWDDEIDEFPGEHGLSKDSGDGYRERTLLHIAAHLGLAGDDCAAATQTLGEYEGPALSGRIIKSFGNLIAGALREACSVEQRSLLMDQVRYSVKMAGEEQTLRLKDCVPTLEEYWEIRMGYSGCGLLFSTIE